MHQFSPHWQKIFVNCLSIEFKILVIEYLAIIIKFHYIISAQFGDDIKFAVRFERKDNDKLRQEEIT
jgi:hypothetical protein